MPRIQDRDIVYKFMDLAVKAHIFFDRLAIVSTNLFFVRVQTLLKCGVIFVTAGICFPIYGIPIGFVRLMLFRIGLIFLMVAFPFWEGTLLNVLRDFRIKCMLMLFVFRFFSLILTSAHYLSAVAIQGAIQLAWFFEGFLCLIILLACIKRYPDLLNFLFKCLLFFGTAAAIVTVQQFVEWKVAGHITDLPLAMSIFGRQTGGGEGSELLFEYGRIMGSFTEPNQAGTLMVFLICLLLPLCFSSKKRKRLITGGILGLAVISIWASASLQSAVTFILVLSLYSFNLFRRKLFLWIFFIVFICAGIVFTVSTLSVDQYDPQLQISGLDQRILLRMVSGDFSSGRVFNSQLIIESLDKRVLLFGQGEGSGEWSAHNAFLIVLQENGIWALTFLILGSASLLFRTQRNLKSLPSLDTPYHILESAPLLSLSWICFITFNWAQLNQSASWVFLAIALAGQFSPKRMISPIMTPPCASPIVTSQLPVALARAIRRSPIATPSSPALSTTPIKSA